MKFGIFDHMDASGRPLAAQIEDRLALAETYDKLGFQALHIAEHHSTPLGISPSPSMFLALAARRTRRLRLGPLVYTLPLYHPCAGIVAPILRPEVTCWSVPAMTRLLILLTLPEKIRMQYYDGLHAAFPELAIDLVDHHSKVDPYIGDADILLTFGAHMADHVLEKGAKLRWIQALGTGVDGIVDRPPFREGVLVTNMHGLHGDSVPEAAIMLMLALARDLPRAMRNRNARKWDRYASRLLKGKAVGIFGVGAIARSLAPKCKSFGMTVVGISSSPRSMEGFDRMVRRDELEAAVRGLDFLVLLTPYTAETHGIVGEKIIDAMKPSAYLVNLARGGIVDEEALLRALREKRLAGAALDVFAAEPLPEDHPFWSMDNVIVTPHLGGFHDQYAEEALPTVIDNFRKFLAGDTTNMSNVVKR